MPYALRDFTCDDCGCQVRKRAAAAAVVTCVPCGIARSAEWCRQLHARRGPHYTRWVFAYANSIRRMARELPPVEVRKTA